MDLHTQNSRWKLYLGIGGTLIVLASMLYTNYLAGRLADEERRKVEIWARAQQELNEFDDEDMANIDVTLHTDIIKANVTIPVILVNATGGIDAAVNFGDELDNDQEFLKQEVAALIADGFTPIQGFAYAIYYKESNILQQLRYFPVIQLLLFMAFMVLGYIGLNASRRAEQNRVWVGMAKETAHQLGTPISAIIAWIEHLKSIREDDPEVLEVSEELRNDVNRLELVADRFSKIGSAPVLEAVNIGEELDNCRQYMARRSPRKVVFDFPARDATTLQAFINPPLFDWVVENLLRNALDAMEGRGIIGAEIYDDADYIYVDISDTGKGIPAGKFKTVFTPGFTTKKRGWGLGLSLAKRIVEEYHSGKIFVKKSVENEGTTFTIRLPKQAPQSKTIVTHQAQVV